MVKSKRGKSKREKYKQKSKKKRRLKMDEFTTTGGGKIELNVQLQSPYFKNKMLLDMMLNPRGDDLFVTLEQLNSDNTPIDYLLNPNYYYRGCYLTKPSNSIINFFSTTTNPMGSFCAGKYFSIHPFLVEFVKGKDLLNIEQISHKYCGMANLTLTNTNIHAIYVNILNSIDVGDHSGGSFTQLKQNLVGVYNFLKIIKMTINKSIPVYGCIYNISGNNQTIYIIWKFTFNNL